MMNGLVEVVNTTVDVEVIVEVNVVYAVLVSRKTELQK
jgi:hypothetical protein